MEATLGAVPLARPNGVDNLPGTSGPIVEQRISEQLPPMPRYIGQLDLLCDGPHNVGAMITMGERNSEKLKLPSHEENSDVTPRTSKWTPGVEISAAKWGKHCEFRRWRLSNLKFDGLMGKGSYGKVWKAGVVDGTVDEEYAVKQLIRVSERDGGEIWKERDFLIYLKHDRVCNLVGAFYECNPYFVFELCHGSLANLAGACTPKQKVRFGVQLMQGVEWIHSKQIVHCDIRADNLLIKYPHNLVITDFGSAFLMPEGYTRVVGTVHRGVGWCQDADSNTHFIYGFGSDIFSCACVLYEMDMRERLLLLPDPNKKTAEDFALLYKNGVVIEWGTPNLRLPNRTLHQLSERVQAAMFGVILKEMVIDVPQRISAADFLNHEALGTILALHQLNLANLDSGPDIITREFVSNRNAIFSKRTDLPLDYIVYGQKCFGMMYYDEKMASSFGDVARKPFHPDNICIPISTVRVASQMVSQGVVGDFVTSLQRQDKFALKVLFGMISDVIRQPVADVATGGITPASIYETAADTQLIEVRSESGTGSRQIPSSVLGSTPANAGISVPVASASSQHHVSKSANSTSSSPELIIYTGSNHGLESGESSPAPKSNQNPVKAAPVKPAPSSVKTAPTTQKAVPNPVKPARMPVKPAPMSVKNATTPAHAPEKSATMRTSTKKPLRPVSPQPPPKVGTSSKQSGYLDFPTPSRPVAKDSLFKHPGLSRKRGSISSNRRKESTPASTSSFGAHCGAQTMSRSNTSSSVSHYSEKANKQSKQRSEKEEHSTKVGAAVEETRRKRSGKEMRKRSIVKRLSETTTDSESDEARTPAKKSRALPADPRSHSSSKRKKLSELTRRRAVSSDPDDSEEDFVGYRRKTSKKTGKTSKNVKKVESSSDTGDEGYLCGVCKNFQCYTREEMAWHQQRCGKSLY